MKVAECIARASELSMEKMPSIAERIQWGTFLRDNYTRDAAEGSLGLLIKNLHDEALMKDIVGEVFGN